MKAGLCINFTYLLTITSRQQTGKFATCLAKSFMTFGGLFMRTNKLGKSSIHISVLGMGCWEFGGGTYWGTQSQSAVNEVVCQAFEDGINYFDTAEMYNDGESERSLGIALKEKRNRAVIGTKVNPSNTRSAILRQHCEESLKRLGIDYIDIYMVHWPITPHSIEHFTQDRDLIDFPPSVGEVFDTLSKLRDEGKIREIGVSNFGVEQMKEVRDTGVEVVVNELPYNLLSRGIEEVILPDCIKNGTGVFGYMALQQGLLAGIYQTPEDVPVMQAHSRHFHYNRVGTGVSRHHEEGAEKEVFRAIGEIKSLADSLGVHIAQLSLAWAMAKSGFVTTLVGSRNVQELGLNVQSATYNPGKEIIDRLDEITLPVLQKLGSNPDYYEDRISSRIR
jgi:myo-inositol catabolism protein IolS